MFGISLTELFVVLIFAIILINPKEYPRVFRSLRSFYADLKRAYKSGIKEFESLKEEVGLTEFDDKLKQDIAGVDEEIKKIVGDDGELYDSYDISEFLDKDDKKN